ncbi:jg329 [Pararge aegeria aegeria]|uniref:Jg329 protein n=1 Tax=Pararge aegeria aegeria TaxID=348720 RepID=A0A8S4R5Q7_9NEOP|nr:jg329 [Pararge aegeria aegeria]
MDVGVRKCWNGSPALVNAALVDPRRGGRTTLSASQVAAGFKRHRNVEFGTPYKRPMSSSGRLSVDMMMMMSLRAALDTLSLLREKPGICGGEMGSTSSSGYFSHNGTQVAECALRAPRGRVSFLDENLCQALIFNYLHFQQRGSLV